MEEYNCKCREYNPKRRMSNQKVKGLLKGLRYISQVFDDDKKNKKNQEIQIGGPTDVKHLAHVGCDGRQADEHPPWIKEYGSPAQYQSASDMSEPPSDGPDWASEDSSKRRSRRDRLKLRHRRHRSVDNSLDANSEGKDVSTKTKQPRRRHTRGTSSDRRRRAESETDGSPPKKLPDIPKKTRKHKPKEESSGGSSRLPRPDADETSSQASTDIDVER